MSSKRNFHTFMKKIFHKPNRKLEEVETTHLSEIEPQKVDLDEVLNNIEREVRNMTQEASEYADKYENFEKHKREVVSLTCNIIEEIMKERAKLNHESTIRGCSDTVYVKDTYNSRLESEVSRIFRKFGIMADDTISITSSYFYVRWMFVRGKLTDDRQEKYIKEQEELENKLFIQNKKLPAVKKLNLLKSIKWFNG